MLELGREGRQITHIQVLLHKEISEKNISQHNDLNFLVHKFYEKKNHFVIKKLSTLHIFFEESSKIKRAI